MESKPMGDAGNGFASRPGKEDFGLFPMPRRLPSGVFSNALNTWENLAGWWEVV
jgi:hypothetical protein